VQLSSLLTSLGTYIVLYSIFFKKNVATVQKMIHSIPSKHYVDLLTCSLCCKYKAVAEHVAQKPSAGAGANCLFVVTVH
jgi:hypothetical protein